MVLTPPSVWPPEPASRGGLHPDAAPTPPVTGKPSDVATGLLIGFALYVTVWTVTSILSIKISKQWSLDAVTNHFMLLVILLTPYLSVILFKNLRKNNRSFMMGLLIGNSAGTVLALLILIIASSLSVG